MAEGRRREGWDRTAFLAALIANCHRDPKKRRRPYSLEDFHPLRRGRQQRQPGSIQDLKVFLSGKGPA